jgi:hypothetical protein
MSLTPTAPRVAALPSQVRPGPRRVRHQARDVAVLMAFSATSSLAVAGAFLVLALVTHSGR